LDFWYLFNNADKIEPYPILLDDLPVSKWLKKEIKGVCSSICSIIPSSYEGKKPLKSRVNLNGKIIKTYCNEQSYYESIRGKEIEVLQTGSRSFEGPLSGTGVYITIPKNTIIVKSKIEDTQGAECVIVLESLRPEGYYSVMIYFPTVLPGVRKKSNWSLEYPSCNKKILLRETEFFDKLWGETEGKNARNKLIYSVCYYTSIFSVVSSYILIILFVKDGKPKWYGLFILGLWLSLLVCNNDTIIEKLNKKIEWDNYLDINLSDKDLYLKNISKPADTETEYLYRAPSIPKFIGISPEEETAGKYEISCKWQSYPNGLKFDKTPGSGVYIKVHNSIYTENLWDIILRLGTKLSESKSNLYIFYNKILSEFINDDYLRGWSICPKLSLLQKEFINEKCIVKDNGQYSEEIYYCINTQAWVNKWKDSFTAQGYIKNYPFPLPFGNKEFFTKNIVNQNIFELPWNYQLYNLSVHLREKIQCTHLDTYLNSLHYEKIQLDDFTEYHCKYLIYELIQFYPFDSVIYGNEIIVPRFTVREPKLEQSAGHDWYEKWKEIYEANLFMTQDETVITEFDWNKPVKGQDKLEQLEQLEPHYNPLDNSRIMFGPDEKKNEYMWEITKKINNNQYLSSISS